MGSFHANILGLKIEHFSKEEQAAQAQAQVLTTKALSFVMSGEVVTLEKLTGTEKLGEAATEVLTRLAAALQGEGLHSDLDKLQGIVGHYGALLTGAIHDLKVPVKSGRWIIVFETLFHLAKAILA